jgi:hypothetical protein
MRPRRPNVSVARSPASRRSPIAGSFRGLADGGRRALLDTRLRRLESSALWQKGRALEAEAERAFAAGRYAEAAERFTAALDAENEFLARYRDVRDTAFGRAEQLAVRRETAASGAVWDEVRRHQGTAEAAEAKADWAGAARAWQDAVDAFARLLTVHPRSEFADRSKEAAIATRLNFARFHDDIVRVRSEAGRLRQALRARQADDALRLAETLLADARRLADAGTGVFRTADAEREELEFIAGHAGDDPWLSSGGGSPAAARARPCRPHVSHRDPAGALCFADGLQSERLAPRGQSRGVGRVCRRRAFRPPLRLDARRPRASAHPRRACRGGR